MEIPMPGAKAAPGEEAASGETGKAKGEEKTPWLQQETTMLMPLLSTGLWPRRKRVRDCFQGCTRDALTAIDVKLWPPGPCTLLGVMGAPPAQVSMGGLGFPAPNQPQNETKHECQM